MVWWVVRTSLPTHTINSNNDGSNYDGPTNLPTHDLNDDARAMMQSVEISYPNNPSFELRGIRRTEGERSARVSGFFLPRSRNQNRDSRHESKQCHVGRENREFVDGFHYAANRRRYDDWPTGVSNRATSIGREG